MILESHGKIPNTLNWGNGKDFIHEASVKNSATGQNYNAARVSALAVKAKLPDHNHTRPLMFLPEAKRKKSEVSVLSAFAK